MSDHRGPVLFEIDADTAKAEQAFARLRPAGG
jgi:hypothetical protein